MSPVPSPAGFWKRYVAYFIDFMLVSMVLNIVTTPLLFLALARDAELLAPLLAMQQQPAASPGALMAAFEALLWPLLRLSALSVVGYALLAAAYFIGMEASARQATLGKQLLGLKVTARDGGPPGLGRVVGRFVAATLSWVTLNLGHALAAWTRDRRALHDYLAGTRVVNVDPANAAMPTWGWVIVGINVLGVLGLALMTVAAALLVWMALPR